MNRAFLEELGNDVIDQQQMLHIVLRPPHDVKLWQRPYFEKNVPPVLSILLADADGMYAVSCQLKAHSAEPPAGTTNKIRIRRFETSINGFPICSVCRHSDNV
eukprot:GHVU01146650.1.p6 GENE.GHVU01146650.1~~GHVU01146650.1.p6  ORF type:complete len:103 (-),score=11.64 GHVU01146650.1:1148-1456(-)